jgi:hypothetical protein
MNWVRSHIKHGSKLALFALAMQFVLAFGHFHGMAAQAAPIAATAIEAAIGPAPAGPQPDSDQPSTNICSICAVLALANTVLFSEPPILLLPQAVEFLYQTTDAEFAHLNSPRRAAQPRAPPAL